MPTSSVSAPRPCVFFYISNLQAVRRGVFCPKLKIYAEKFGGLE